MGLITFRYFKKVSTGEIKFDEKEFEDSLKQYLNNKIHFYCDLDNNYIDYKITSREFIDRKIIELHSILNNLDFKEIDKTQLFMILDKAQILLKKAEDRKDSDGR